MAKCSENGIRLSCVCISDSDVRVVRRGLKLLFSPFSDEPGLPEQQQHQSHLALQRSGRVGG